MATLLVIVFWVLPVCLVWALRKRGPTQTPAPPTDLWTVYIQVGSKIGWVQVTDGQVKTEVWTPAEQVTEADVLRWLLFNKVPPRQIVGIRGGRRG